ncbi:MAG: non-homologous end-joining DNA ligase [Candidatus Nanopelagicales bacterium]
MLASPGDLPRTSDRSWAYEVKWDGMRLLGTLSRGRLRLTSRNGNDATTRFLEVAEAAPEGLPEGSVLDGEVVAFDPEGRPSFALLAPRIQRAQPPGPHHARLTFLVFDLLRLGDVDVTGRSYDERRALLAEHVVPTARVLVPDSFDEGEALLASTEQRGLEGVVAKRRASTYQQGVRSPDWVKVPHRRSRSLVIGGWKSREDSRSRLASLLVGTPTDDGMLRYEGAVGSGLSGSVSRTLLEVLGEIVSDDSPFHGYPAPEEARGDVHTYVTPVLVVDVEHLGRAANGLLRQPSVVRLRPDLSYADVVEGA